MDVETLSLIVLVVVPLLLLVEGVIVLLVWGIVGGGMPWLVARWHVVGRPGVGGAAVGYWLLATTATGLVIWLASFVGVHLLLFNLGPGAAWLGFVLSVLAMAATPIGWALVMDRRDRRRLRQ